MTLRREANSTHLLLPLSQMRAAAAAGKVKAGKSPWKSVCPVNPSVDHDPPWSSVNLGLVSEKRLDGMKTPFNVIL